MPSRFAAAVALALAACAGRATPRPSAGAPGSAGERSPSPQQCEAAEEVCGEGFGLLCGVMQPGDDCGDLCAPPDPAPDAGAGDACARCLDAKTRECAAGRRITERACEELRHCARRR
jgi:hypothetical protein